jgi:phosphopantothenoylcysteine decarboxylase/phosphopantothenate--cysteine ligase
MQRLYRKRIVLGVGGGIAAYKSADLVRRLMDQGAEVRVVMTRGGAEFITPLTMQALSGHPVHLDCWTRPPKPPWATSNWPNGPIWC